MKEKLLTIECILLRQHLIIIDDGDTSCSYCLQERTNACTKLITLNLLLPLHTIGGKHEMTEKRNVVLYMDTELVKKSHELGLNLSKTFEKPLKTVN